MTKTKKSRQRAVTKITSLAWITFVFIIAISLVGIQPTDIVKAQTCVTSRISTSSDDAEERMNTGDTNGDVDLDGDTSNHYLQMYRAYGGSSTDRNWWGLRFLNVDVPQSANITSAKVTFRATANSGSTASGMTLWGQLAANPTTFTTTDFDISSRTHTTASIAWTVPQWTSGSDYQTPDLTSIVQEIVNQAGWAANNALVILGQTTVSQNRSAASRDSTNGSSLAPLLEVCYQVGPSITISGSLSPFVTPIGTPSAAQSYTVSGANLTSDIVITSPAGFEISLNQTSGFSSVINLTPSGGVVSITTIWVRLTGAAGSFSGNISHTSTGAAERLLPVSGQAVTYFTLTITAAHGSVTLDPPGGSYPPDTTVTLTPIPDSSYIFDGWSGTNASDIVETDGIYTILMDANKSVTAIFVTAVCEDKSIEVSADTFMNSGNTKGNYNYGGSTTIQLNPYYQQGGTDQYRAPLLRWDLSGIPTNALVTNASLKFYVTTGETAYTYNLYSLRRDWVEGTNDGATGSGASWNYYDAGTNSWGTAGAANTSTDRFDVNLWNAVATDFGTTGNVTFPLNTQGVAVIQEWVNTPTSNHGLTIQNYTGTSTGSWIAASRENTSGYTKPTLNLTYCVSTAPTITTSGALTHFSTLPGVRSDPQTYTVSGRNLTTGINITAPTGFLISTDGSNYLQNLTLTPVEGTIETTTIYVVLSSDTLGDYSGNITHTSEGATTKYIAVEGTVSTTICYQDQEFVSAADTYMSSYNVTYNYGAQTYMRVTGGGSSNPRGSLLKFDLSALPTSATVTEANLKLYVSTAGSATFDLYNLRRAWVEGTGAGSATGVGATWETYDGTNSWGANGAADTSTDRYDDNLWGADSSSFSSTGSKLIALNDQGLAVVQDWVDGDLTNHGLTIQNYTSGTTDVQFSTKENDIAANHPRLVLDYCIGDVSTYTFTVQVSPDGSGTVTLSPSGGSYMSGTVVTLTPVPNGDYQFHSWSGEDAEDIINTSGTYTILMDSDKSIIANFSHAPNAPVLVQPTNGATGVTLPPTLIVTVSDPDNDTMSVSFYGRVKEASEPAADFTIFAIPDTQNLVASPTLTTVFNAQTQYIVDHKVDKNVAFVTGLGDITNTSSNETEWQRADAAMDILDSGSVPYSVGPGNHDIAFGTTFYTNYFGSSRFSGKSWYKGYYTSGSDNYNNYSIFSAGGMDFILINLQYNAGTGALDWADALLKANPNKRGIVEQHDILNTDNSWVNQATYNALSDNPNLFLMLCGHMHTSSDGSAYRLENRTGMNPVHILLTDYQDYTTTSNTGYMRMLTFKPASDEIYAQVYSPYISTFLTSSTNYEAFTMSYDMEGTMQGAFELIGTVSGVTSGSNASISWTGLTVDKKYEWYAVANDGGLSTTSLTWSFTTGTAVGNHAPVLDAIGNKSVNELVELTFTAHATDIDLPAQTLTYSLVSAPTGASINSTSGLFSWTPTEAQGPGEYTFTVKVCDNGSPVLCDEEQITVTVSEVNVAPVLGAIGNKSIAELTALTFTAIATDLDVPANTLTYSLESAPTGASINSTSGLFSWTPTEAQGPGEYTFKVKVCDNGSPVLCDEEQITVTVNEVNVAPVLAEIGDKSVAELALLTFTATATDADLPAQTLVFSLAGEVPEGAAITAAGAFSWTPSEAQGPDEYTFDVCVSDGALSDCETITVTVSEVNVAPVLGAIGNKSIAELATLTFTAIATDVDLPANTLTYSLESAPTGASINSTSGLFSWTPTEAQGPGEYTFKVKVCDNGSPVLCDEEQITVTVNEVNVAPVLGVIGNKNIEELVPFTFTATATDEDIPANTLTFSLQDGTAGHVPTGASINLSTGVFTWTPTEAQGPGEYTFDVCVSDGALSDCETITITVYEALQVTALDLWNATAPTGPWTAVPGNYPDGFVMQLDPAVEWYYLDTNTITSNRPLADGLYPFTISRYPTGFFDYWAGRGVVEGATGWQGVMWQIINGDLPFFYLKVEGTQYTLLDGLQYAMGNTTALLRVDGTYLLGAYTFSGEVEDDLGFSDALDVDISFVGLLQLTDAQLQYSPNQTTWTDLGGSFSVGYSMLLDTTVEYYYLNAPSVTVNRPLALGLHPFYIESYPSGFFAYWAGRGVVEGATGWQGVMWQIINGNSPIFYLKVSAGPTYQLVDGLSYQYGGVETYLRIDGTYLPGLYSFSGTVTDDYGYTDEVLVDILFNDIPVAEDQSVSTPEDTALGITLTAVDLYPGTLTWTVDTQPLNGTLSGTAPVLTYMPAANYYGSDSFTFKVSDGTVVSNIATVTITVAAVNDAPVTEDITAQTDEDTPVAIKLVASDVDGNEFTFSIVTQPAHGALSGTAPAFTYTPALNYNGTDSFTYKASDGELESEPATVTITVAAVNDAPVANNMNVTTAEDTAKAITLDASDVDGDSLTATIVAQPTHGTVSLSGLVATYTPTANYNGTDSFTYKVNDSTVDSNIATVSITVAAVNDAPVAENASVETDEDTPVEIELVASDVDGDELTFTVVTQPAHGTLSGTAPALTYTPALNYNGEDSFTFKANDSTVDSNIATVSITIATVNDAPVAKNVTAETEEDTSVEIELVASDVDGDELTFAVVTQPAHGTLSGTAPALTYAPEANFNGTDSFTFKANDGTVDSNEATVSITVAAVNDAPVANNMNVITAEDTAKAITLDVSDIDGDTLTATIVAQPQHGTVDLIGLIATYTPAADYYGLDSFTYKVNDGTVDSNIATVTVTVTAVNDAPVAEDVSAETNEDTPVEIELVASDVDGDELEFIIVTQPAHGTLSGTAPDLTYTPALNYNGEDSFTFKANDSTVDSNVATVEITIAAVNDAPVAEDVSAETNEDTPVEIELVASDVEGDELSAEIVDEPAHGDVTIEGLIATYTPEPDFNGTDSFTYKVFDGALYSNESSATITITPVNDAPLANTMDVTTAEDTAKEITLDASDVDEDTLTATIIAGPSHGTAVVDGIVVTYTPAVNYNGSDSFVYRVNDGYLSSNLAVVYITVTPVNDAPVSQNISTETDEDTPVEIELVASDVDGDELTAEIVTDPLHGEVTLEGFTVIYAPDPDYNGLDSFTYKVFDGELYSEIATVSITIAAVNDAPVAYGATVETTENTAVEFELLASDPDGDLETYIIVNMPGHGSLVCDGKYCIYTPEAHWFGTDNLVFKVFDGEFYSEKATVYLQVLAWPRIYLPLIFR